MGRNTRIEWASHTFNPWWGCVKVSEACKHCYAEAWAKRTGQRVWGPKAPRRAFSDAHWRQPLIWDRALAGTGRRERVFCASMADVFEDRRDLDPHRERLWGLIEATPNLDWLLLTKRPQMVSDLAPWGSDWPMNVWLGTTVELQHRAEEGLPALAAVPAKVRFVSAEPLLGPLDLEPWLGDLHWVISGGESGPRARPASPSWFRDLQRQCEAGGVAFHFKQWGDWAPDERTSGEVAREGGRRGAVRTTPAADGTLMARLGKKAAGRLLDGAELDGLPAAVAI